MLWFHEKNWILNVFEFSILFFIFTDCPRAVITFVTFTTKLKLLLLTRIIQMMMDSPWHCHKEQNMTKWSKLLPSIWKWILLTYSSSKLKVTVKSPGMRCAAPSMGLSKIYWSILGLKRPKRCFIKSWQYPFTSSKIRSRSSVPTYQQIRYAYLFLPRTKTKRGANCESLLRCSLQLHKCIALQLSLEFSAKKTLRVFCKIIVGLVKIDPVLKFSAKDTISKIFSRLRFSSVSNLEFDMKYFPTPKYIFKVKIEHFLFKVHIFVYFYHEWI